MNLSNELLFLLQGGAGAVSGYITNKYAVNMLFKEYTPFKAILPFKFGGVIKNRKEQFIEEISELVERDIINSETIISNINEEKFEKVLAIIVKDFLDSELRHSLKDMEFKDINDFENIIYKLIGSLKNTIKTDTEFIDQVLNKINLNDDLNNELIRNICCELFDTAEQEILSTDIIEQSLHQMYGNIKCIQINELLPKESSIILKEVLVSSADSSLQSLFENDDKLIKILDDIYEKTDVKAALQKVQENFYNKRISEFISDEECEILSSRLFKVLISYMNSEGGREKFDSLLSFIFKIINDLDYTIYDLLSEDSAKRLTEFIEVSIHKMLPYFSNWISTNKDEFDTIIEQSIDEAIRNLDPGIKKMIISKVRQLFLDNVAAKNKIVEKITHYIENYNIDENSLDDICSMVLDYLKKTKISEMFNTIKSSSIVDSSSLEKIISFLKDQFNIHGQNIINSILKGQTSKKIGDIIHKDLACIFDDNIKNMISSAVLNNKEMLHKNMVFKLDEIISKNINEIETKKIDQLVSNSMSEKIIHKGDSYIKNLLHDNKTQMVDNMYSYITNSLCEIQSDKNMQAKIYDKILNFAESAIMEKRSCKIYDSIGNIICRDEVYESVSKTARKIIIENLDSLLRGKIKETIKNNLKQYDEDEICDLAQRFMGSELKPLSLFGGILGFVCGIIFGFFFRNVGISGFYKNAASQILSVFLMGIVGIMTNVIAINMLFKPYTKNKVLDKIPFLRHFALGYIPAHKENMSRAIGNVIDNDLLNRNYIIKSLNRHKNTIKNKLLSIINKHDDNIIIKFIISQKEKAAEIISKAGFDYIINNKKVLVNTINNTIGNISVDNDFLKKEAINNIIQKAEIDKKIKQVCNQYINEHLDNEICINDIITSEMKDNLSASVNKSIDSAIKDLHSSIDNMDIKSDLSHYITHMLNDDKITGRFEKKISKFIINNSGYYLQDVIKRNMDNFIDNVINDESTIENVFDGKIKIYIDKNLFKITDFAVDKIKLLLIKNEELIKDSVKLKINESLNFFEKIGYTMAGGDNIVDNAVNIMVEKNLPVFISDKFFEITNVIKDGMDNSIFKLKIKDICPSVNANEINSLIQSVYEIIKNNETMTDELSNGAKVIINHIFKQFDGETITALINKLNDEIYTFKNVISDNIHNNQRELTSYGCNTVINLIINPIYVLKVKPIAEKFNSDDVMSSLDNIIDKLDLVNIITENTYIMLKGYLNGKCIADIIDSSMTEKYLSHNFNMIGDSPVFKTTFNKVTSGIIYKIIENIDSLINKETRLQISDKLTDAGLTSCINYCDEIIKSVNLKEITNKQIEIMNPKELHQLFISFSGPLFKKLYLYGSFGAVFGINLWIPVILGAKECITSVFSHTDEVTESKTTI